MWNKELVKDIESLKEFTKPNIFDILGVANTEIRHSFMLAWLLNPDENHGLGDAVLHGWIHRYTEPRSMESFRIQREFNNIDLLAVSEKERMLLCIENKTFSGEHDDQLNRYRVYLEETFPGYEMILVYLTPTGKIASDPEHWHPMSYADVHEIINKAKEGKQLTPEVELILRNYIDVIKRIGGESIQTVCRKIYRKHQIELEQIWERREFSNYQKELNIIKNNKPRVGTDPIADAIVMWASERSIPVYRQSDAYIRFKTDFMAMLLPDAENAISGWNTSNFYFYEIRNQVVADIHEVWISLAIDTRDMPADLLATTDRFFPKNKKTGRFRLNYSTSHIHFNETDDDEKVKNQMDELIQEVFLFEQGLKMKL